jgi:hypothetical protein
MNSFAIVFQRATIIVMSARALIYGEKRRFVIDSGNPGQKCRFAAARPPAAIARFPAPR